MKIGLIGAGAIANYLLKEINEHQHEHLQITSIFVRNKEKYLAFESKYGVSLFTDLEEFLDSEVDIVVEAANIQAVKSMLSSVLKKKDVMIISVGALSDEGLWTEINNLIDQYNKQLYLPSGAVGGLDLLQNAHALGTIEEVSLTTRKPAKSLIGEEVSEEKVVFQGKAVNAIQQFPKNMNVSIILSIAGIGIEKTNVCLIADPHIEKNMHQVDIKGDFGEATCTITNNALPENPKTSYLAAMSIIGTLQRIQGKIKIGI